MAPVNTPAVATPLPARVYTHLFNLYQSETLVTTRRRLTYAEPSRS